ncbi:hypothetical protein [Schinkia azotoformans]|uniref:hypothetical protein n=1 Tax=Schinkia azotoformans TaxID=1454 RepID=UPI002DBB69B7|nr:hypothetical protein [Schinkia azotoformans]MEC1780058.1 hypothetical protein [Schinkia azotoformans]MED4330863.1 hypothetical protein [Schinkia azotoformans]
MKKVINTGIYCGKCKLFIRNEDVVDWECHCSAEAWEDAKIVLITEGDKNE